MNIEAQPAAERLSFKEKVAYGLGDTASNFYWQMFLNFLLFFYTDVFGISAAAAGTMFLVVRTWDTGIDPLVGVMADRTHTRWGHYRPYLLWGAPPLAAMGVLMFTTPGLSTSGKLVYAYVSYSLIMIAYTFINIPYSALMGVISPNSLERTSVSSYRFVLAYGGMFMVQGLTLPMVKFFGHGNDQKGFQMAMVVFGIMAIALFLIAFAATRERVQPAQQRASAIRDDLKDLVRNVPWIMTCFIGLFALCYDSLRLSAILYYFKYYVGSYHFQAQIAGHSFSYSFDSGSLASPFMALGTVGVIVGAAMARPLTRWLGGKRRAYMLLMTTASVLTALFYFIPREQIILIFVTHLLISTLFAPTSPLLWAFYADTADHSEWKTGRRATGLVFSAASFSQKLGWAIGGTLAGWLLAYFGFRANIAQTNQVQTGVRCMMTFMPAAAGFLSAAAVLFYKLDDSFMEKIERELKQRKGEQH
ncbi:MAG TPA: MFS transporter [Terriglobales bacterium]|nr:MFS transporter [Terriglobales bacterium]